MAQPLARAWLDRRRKNLLVEYRYAPDRLPALAAELVALTPELIIASGPQRSVALKSATATIPIVFVAVSDPVGLGLVGPNALRGSGPEQKRALWKSCVDPSGFSRSPERPYLHYVVMPSPIGVAGLSAGVPHAASIGFGSLYLSFRTMMAQAIRAILLASATTATLVVRRSINRPCHGRLFVPCLRA